MSKYKIGDKVRLIEQSEPELWKARPGDVGEVVDDYAYDVYRVKFDFGIESCYEEELELVTDKKVGKPVKYFVGDGTSFTTRRDLNDYLRTRENVRVFKVAYEMRVINKISLRKI